MNKLTVLNKNGKLLVDSREVAGMVGKEHKNLLRDIKGYEEILTGSTLSPSNFFIKDEYVDNKHERRNCYLLTKKGCDMVANKMIGTKGILFTAEYVTKFDEMEKELHYEQKLLSPKEQLKLQLEMFEEQDKKIDGVVKNVADLQANMPLFNVDCKDLQLLVRKIGIKMLGGYRTPAYRNNSLRTKVYKDIQGQLKRQFGVNRYESIKRVQMDPARETLEKYNLPMFLQDDITLLNNQTELPFSY